MFGIDGPEFLVILVALIVVIGPKDLPRMMRTFGKATARVRTTAYEFRQQFDQAMKDAELDDVQKSFSDITDLDPRKKLSQVFDPIRDVAKDVRSSLQDNSGESNTVITFDEGVPSDIKPDTNTIPTLMSEENSGVLSDIPAHAVSKVKHRVIANARFRAIKSTPGIVVVKRRPLWRLEVKNPNIIKRKTKK